MMYKTNDNTNKNMLILSVIISVTTTTSYSRSVYACKKLCLIKQTEPSMLI